MAAARPPNPPPDGGWGWAVTAGAFITLFFTNGLPQSFGVFFVEFRDYFQASAKSVSLIGALLLSMIFFTSPISAGLANTKGCRPIAMVGGVLASLSLIISSFAPGLKFLYVFMGILTGFGFSLGFVPSLGIVAQYFKKKYIMATAVSLSGVALGTIIFPPLCNRMINKYGWRSSLFLLGAMTMNILVGSALFRPLNPTQVETDEESSCSDSEADSISRLDAESTDVESASDSSESEDSTITKRKGRTKEIKASASNGKPKALDISVFKSYRYLLICVICVLIGMSFVTSVIFLVPYATSRGIPLKMAAYLMSVFGLVNFLGRLLQGILANAGLLTPTKFLCIHLLVITVANFLIPSGKSYAAFVAYAVFAGLSMAGTSALFPALIRGMVGDEKFQSGVGLSQIFVGSGTFLGPVISGTLIDKTGGFKAAFMFSGFLAVLSFVLMLLEPVLHKLELAKELKKESEEMDLEKEIEITKAE
ncbi:monocarboxylate transporter 2-like [Ptychodera flava]|uniref:monocarboxylate transporter 2-like n=1 Tax=Ptychodera flava TaxID=63121 RepID=UPI00396A1A89